MNATNSLTVASLTLAEELHQGQLRKGTDIPYLSHLLAVASLVMEDGGSPTVVAAALLHDAAEDQGGEATLDLIAQTCSEEVASIVRECSDSLAENPSMKAPWRERKQRALDTLPSKSSGALMVIAADKLHNVRATMTDLAISGPSVWDRFKTGRDGFIWYHDEMALALTRLVPGSRSLTMLRIAMEDLRGM